MRQYAIRRNFFSIDNKYTIYENGAAQYQLRGGALFGGIDNLILEDGFGTPLVRIEQIGHFWHPTFELISADGQPLARMRKPFFGFNLEISTIHGPYRVVVSYPRTTGYYSLWDAADHLVARRTAIMEVAQNEDQVLVLALLVILNQVIKPQPSNSHVGGH